MNNDKTYNGWTNHETWAFVCMYGDEITESDTLRELAKDCLSDDSYNDFLTVTDLRKNVIYDFAYELRDYFNDLLDVEQYYNTKDDTYHLPRYVVAALQEFDLQNVDWRCISDAYLPELLQEMYDNDELD